MARAKKKAGEINSSSMADIAFLLLIFFLVTTTMDVDTGMKRTLPPWIDPTEQQNDVDVNERNVLKVNVSRSGAIMVGTEEYRSNDLRRTGEHSRLSREVYFFLVDPDRSNKKEVEIDGATYKVSEGLVSLKADDETEYKVYLKVQDELTHAFNLYRDDIARQVYGKKYDELNDLEAQHVRKAVPMKISEAEPNDQTKK
ncbi:MAG: biopolymer transporter ExbD [Alistipes sp.]|nr:biopolymer transporter ExbD [Alistipes sp.]MBO7264577.1 biopolymer transporter ExbD [Alistipes sp.]